MRELARRWKIISGTKLLFLPHILNPGEKYAILALAALAVLSGSVLLARTYLSLTVPRPEVGGEFREGTLREPRTVNPIFAVQDTERDLARLIFAGLFYYNGKGEIIPDLAKDYEISEDGKTYTVTLRDNLSWHDGKPLTAEDVVFTVSVIQNPQYKSALRANWQGVTAEKLDDKRVRFTLRTLYAPFIENLTAGIIPKHLWQNIAPGEAALHELNLRPVGAGPYYFRRIAHASDGTLSAYELARNPDYHREGPYLAKIIFVFFKTEEEMLGAFRKGAIDAFGPATERQFASLSGEKVKVTRAAMPRIFGLFFNERKNPALKERAVREALALALDRQKIALQAAPGNAVPYSSPIPPTSSMKFAKEVNSPQFDPAAAAEILTKADWTDEDGDGIREKTIKNKGKTETRTLTITISTSDWPELMRAAEEIKSELSALGFDVRVEIRAFPQLEAEIIRPRNFEVLLFGQVLGYEPDLFPFWHSSQQKDPGLNVALYSRKEADAALEEARKTRETARRAEKYAEFEIYFNRDLPALILYSQLYLYLIPRDLEGMAIDTISLPADRFNEVNLWYRETQRVLK